MASFIYKNILASPAFSLLSAYSMVIKGDLICKIDAIYNYMYNERRSRGKSCLSISSIPSRYSPKELWHSCIHTLSVKHVNC